MSDRDDNPVPNISDRVNSNIGPHTLNSESLTQVLS